MCEAREVAIRVALIKADRYTREAAKRSGLRDAQVVLQAMAEAENDVVVMLRKMV